MVVLEPWGKRQAVQGTGGWEKNEERGTWQRLELQGESTSWESGNLGVAHRFISK